ncbi:sensor histidine kinase [Nocardiopsis algeriensis]|uniref:sensor histidine kinase n=1 Tax=Nocardiopsis algeriensis TaxID=1478215 RepID=UPI003B43413A
MAAPLSDRKRSRPRPGRQAFAALLAVAALSAAVWLWAVNESPDTIRAAVAQVGGAAALLLCAAVTAAVHQAAAARSALARLADAEVRSRQDREARTEIEDQVTALADTAVPLMLRRIREDRTTAAEVLAGELPEVLPPVAHLRRTVLDQLLEADSRTATAMISTADCGARIQARLTTLLAQLRELEERYGDRSDIFSDLLKVDHNVSRTGRLADTLVTLAGGRSGRRWTRPIVMESILRGAAGRITAYRRVRLHSTSTLAVVGHAAEGVMQALAEVMDNAVNFSAHGTDAHVYVQEEDTGIVVTVEDSGLGIRRRERRLAESLLSEPRDLSTLPSSRMGLAVVGSLAHKYGLKVSLRPSARGGTGVVLLIPTHLLTEPRAPEPRPSTRSTAESSDGPGETVASGEDASSRPDGSRPSLPRRSTAGTAEAPSAQPGGLPRRRRGRTLAEAVRENPEQLFPLRSASAGKQVRGGLSTRFSAFREAVPGSEEQHSQNDA